MLTSSRRQRRRGSVHIHCAVLLLLLQLSWLLTPVTSQEKLLFGYQIQNDVSEYLYLANSIHDIRKANNSDVALRVYTNTSSPISLSTLSTESWNRWRNVPIYNTYVAGFSYLGSAHEGDVAGEFDRQPAPRYADTLVRDLFQLGPDTTLEATASVALAVVMAYWGNLWDVLLECQLHANTETLVASLDAAVALWIGAKQERNENQMGYLLYNMAEQAGARFGQDEGETIVNTQFLELVLGIKRDLADGQCGADRVPGGYELVRSKVQLLVQHTNVVLVQMLLHHIQDVVDNGSSSDFVEMFSLSILPQVFGCDKEIFDVLVENTVNNDAKADARDATIQALQKAYSCLGITCAQVGSYEYGLIDECVEEQIKLAGYQTVSGETSIAFIDRDLRQMRLAMELENWIAAADLYVHGWNSEFNLRKIATNKYPWTTSDDFRMYEDFYTNDPTGYGFSDSLIQNALQGTHPFTNTSAVDRMAVVVGTIQSNVLFMGIIGQIDAALSACDDDLKDTAVMHWDGAASLIIGSTEGSKEGGQDWGQSLFAISKQFCKEFGTCEEKTSVVDTVLLASWKAGTVSIHLMACEEVQYILTDDVLPNLLIPLLQGLLYYTVQASSQNESDGAHGYLLAYTQSILPYIQNQEDARTLQTNSDHFRDAPNTVDVTGAFHAVKNAVAPLQLDCGRIGQIEVGGKLFGVCGNDDQPPNIVTPSEPQVQAPSALSVPPRSAPALVPVPSQIQPAATPATSTPASKSPTRLRLPTITSPNAIKDLAWGRFLFTNTTLADHDSRFTLDVKDMYFKQDPVEAWNLYSSPSQNAVHGLSEHSEVRSLQDFSTKASLIMGQDPVYNFFRVALFDDSTFDDNTTGVDNGWPYADAVEDLAVGKDNGNSAQLGSKVVVVMEIWMMIAHKLHESARRCENSRNVPELIDSAVALWIGQDQEEGKFRSGWSVYSVAQEAMELFGLPEGEAKVNKILMDLFGQAQALTLKCSTDKKVAPALRMLVDEIVRNLSVCLLQHLLFHISELFALSLIPQTIGVDESGYEFLRDALFEGFSWDTTVNTQFLETFGKTLQAMRFTCDDFGDTSHAQDNLQGLVSVLCDEVSITFDKTILAGYQTSSDVSELSRIDLDIHQIDIFMRANAYDLAFRVYRHGRNSRRSETELLSLYDLATAEGVEVAGKQYEDSGDFYLTNTYSDRVVTQAIADPEGSRFSGSSRRQRSEEVRRGLQCMVIYLQIISRLRSGIALCRGEGSQIPREKVDEAVALFVGSIEGPFSGGSADNAGQSFYAIGKEYCIYFNTCESHGDADANVRLQFAFSNMKEAFDNFQCNAAETILEDSVLPLLLVPLVQGTLYYAHVNEGSDALSASKNLTAGDMFAETLLPQIAKVNETAAAAIFENMDFEFGEPSVRSGKQVVFDAFSGVARGMGLDCDRVGVLEAAGLGICPAIGLDDLSVGPNPRTPVSLGEDLYMSTTYVQDRANIALDIKEMEKSLLLGHIWSAKVVYMDGRNSAVYDLHGKEVDLRSLKQFSVNAAHKMTRNPLYQVTVHALGDERGMHLGRSATKYADSIVNDLIDKAADQNSTVAADAAVALNLWMELVNELYQTVEQCRNGELTDEDGIHSIDEAVAYWIGDGQIAGDGDNGHLMYALAERMGGIFNARSSGQSRANTNILRLFHEAKIEVSVTGGCSPQTSATAHRVRRSVDKLVSTMLAVHVQALVHELVEGGDRDRVRVYAHVVVPPLSVCNSTNYKYLKESLLTPNYKEVDVENIVRSLRLSLSCLGLRCDDVGIHRAENPFACANQPSSTRLSEYKPTSDVTELSRLDLDLQEIEILLEQGAFEAAEEIYSFGKHASLGDSAGERSALSLEYLATSAGRSIVPQLDSYRRFYNGDDHYADTIIRNALTEQSSTEQSKAIVTTSQVMIVYMAILQYIYESTSQCKPSGGERQNSASKRWDRVAALIVGSLEGSTEAGSTEGRFLWSLSKDLCQEFGTCSQQTPGSSKTNDRISSLLYAGRGATLDGNCEELRKLANELSLLLRVPLFQAVLSVISRLSRSTLRDKPGIQAEAHVYAHALLPLIADLDRDVAVKIERNFPLQGHALKDGSRSVINAYLGVMSGLDIDCHEIGISREVNACQGVAAPNDDLFLIIMSVATAIILVAGIITLMRVIHTRNKPENTPTFIRAQDGELNHLSDVAPKKEDTDWTEELTNACSAMLPEEKPNKDDEAYIQAIEDALNGTEAPDEASEARKLV